MSMLHAGMIDMSRTERIAVDQLLLKEGEKASISRRDPDDSGPLLVKLEDDRVYVVESSGEVSLG